MDYKNGKIYKIESCSGDKIYIGSTTKKYLCQRFYEHKSSYKRWKDGKCTKTMAFELFDEYGLDQCKIILLELCPCESKDMLTAREAFYIKNNECVNKQIPQRSKLEYYADNKENCSQRSKGYYKSHSFEIKERTRQYSEDHKEETAAYKKAYRLKNIERLCERNECECGGQYLTQHKTTHAKTKRHIAHFGNGL